MASDISPNIWLPSECMFLEAEEEASELLMISPWKSCSVTSILCEKMQITGDNLFWT